MSRNLHEPAGAHFSAPTGRRVRLLTALSFIVILLACGTNLALIAGNVIPQRAFWPVVLAPLSGLAVVLPVVFCSCVRGYRLVAGRLQVARYFRTTEFSLGNLQAVEVDPQALRYARKRLGNDGAGAITGRFRNDRLGDFEVLATDPARAVVLRWPQRTLVVTPDRPEEFADTVRRHARWGT